MTDNKQIFSRRACLKDFFDTTENIKNKNFSHDNISIAKNQKEFGHKKRIKP